MESFAEEAAACEQAAQRIVQIAARQPAQARGLVAELNAEEVSQVVGAATHRDIEAILSKAHDRRSQSAANEALVEQTALRRSALAQRAIERLGTFSSEEANQAVAKLTHDEQRALAALADDPAGVPQISKVLEAAEKRLIAADAQPAATPDSATQDPE